MLFNSPEFLLLFLPVTWVVFMLLRGSRSALLWLSLASLFFYGYWNPRYLLLLGASVLACLLYTSPSPRDLSTSRMPSSA